MYYRRTFRRKPRYTYHEGTAGQHSAPPHKPRRAGGISLILFLCSILIFLACALAFLKDLSTQIAVSDASDIVISQVNTSIAEIMKDEDYTGDYFVNFEKTDAGEKRAVGKNTRYRHKRDRKSDNNRRDPDREPDGRESADGARPQGSGADNSAHLVKGGIQQQHQSLHLQLPSYSKI